MREIISSDTIVALATPPGRSGVAVVRLSGPAAADVTKRLTGHPLPLPRQATLFALHAAETNEPIDRALVIWFPAPHSFTGEDVVEFHTHGSRAVIKELIEELTRHSGIRIAEPGEFTRRAFLHQKIGLTEAEGLADLIDAETTAQKKQALRQLGGELGRFYEEFRGSLVKVLAHLEAYIDFPDEEIPESVLRDIANRITELSTAIAKHLQDNHRGEKIREGICVVILGAPNVGKSTLMNYLARREVAIVSPHAGTTRDALEIHLDIGGYPVTLIDTAGLRDGADAIEGEGVRRAKLRAEEADIVIALFDATALPHLDSQTLSWVRPGDLVLLTKCDAINSPYPQKIQEIPSIPISIHREINIEILFTELQKRLSDQFVLSSAPLITRARHRHLLTETQSHLQHFSKVAALELRCEELRLAARAIGKITGMIEVDELLDEIFRTFCIGK